MPVFYLNALTRHRADALTALRQLNSSLLSASSSPSPQRLSLLQSEFSALQQKLAKDAEPRSDGLISTAHLVSTLKKLVPEDTVTMLEAVTMTGIVLDHLRPTLPGSLFNSGAGGLGWFGGAAIGAKIGLDMMDKKSGRQGLPRFVMAIVGDGTFLFSVPASVYWMSRRYNVPFLTIVLNNSGWNAPRKSAQLVHPASYTASATNKELNISFDPSPDYAGIAKAAAGGELWGGSVKTVEEMERVLKEAVEVVKGGKSAVVDAHIVGSGF